MPYQYNPPATINAANDVMNDALRGVRRGTEEDNSKIAYLAGLAAFLVNPERDMAARFAPYKGKSFKGAYLETSARISRPQGIGFRPEGGRLPSPTAQRYAKFRLPVKKLHSRTRMTPEAQADMAGGDGSFKAAMGEMLKGIREAMEFETQEAFHVGRYRIMGIINGAPTAGGVMSLQPASARGYLSPNFWYRGLGISQAGTQEDHPFYRDYRIAGVPSTGISGSTYSYATNGWASGDSLAAAAEGTPDNEVYINAIDGSVPASPNITAFLASSGAAFDASLIANINGAAIIPFGSRRRVQDTSDLLSIDTMHSMSGAYEYMTGSSIYAAAFGVNKVDVSGMMPNVFANPAAAGMPRVFSDGLLGLSTQQAMKRSGKYGKEAFTSWSVWREMAKEHDNLRRAGMVFGSGETAKVGNDPKGYSYIGSGGLVTVFPHHHALEGDLMMLNDAFEYVSSWNQTKLPTRWIPDYDVEEDIMSMRGNVMGSNAFSLSLIADVACDAFALT